jgi:hypothetical protein
MLSRPPRCWPSPKAIVRAAQKLVAIKLAAYTMASLVKAAINLAVLKAAL